MASVNDFTLDQLREHVRANLPGVKVSGKGVNKQYFFDEIKNAGIAFPVASKGAGKKDSPVSKATSAASSSKKDSGVSKATTGKKDSPATKAPSGVPKSEAPVPSDRTPAPSTKKPAASSRGAKNTTSKVVESVQTSSDKLYVPVLTEHITVAIGAYGTDAEALSALLSFIKTNLPNKYNRVISTLDKGGKNGYIKLTPELMANELLSNKKLRQGFEDEISFTLEVYPVGEVPDFRSLTDWELPNLYDMVTAVVSRKAGTFDPKQTSELVEACDSEDLDELEEDDTEDEEGVDDGESGATESEDEDDASENEDDASEDDDDEDDDDEDDDDEDPEDD